MATTPGEDRIEDVAPGDMIAVDRGAGERFYKAVHITAGGGADATDGDSVLVTFDDDDGETFEWRFAGGAVVTRALESKWESEQVGRTQE